MSAPINDGGPAFPVPATDATDGRTHDGGMSLRDWFAGQAMASLFLNQGITGLAIDIAERGGPAVRESIASKAYQISDAMLAAREAK